MEPKALRYSESSHEIGTVSARAQRAARRRMSLNDLVRLDMAMRLDYMALAETTPEKRQNRVWVAFLFGLTLCIGVVTTISFEMVVRRSPGSAQLVTFIQFLFIVLTLSPGIPTYYRRKAPFLLYFGVVLFNFATAYLGNLSLAYGGQAFFPVYLTIKSGTLAGNVLYGYSIQRKTYQRQQIVGTALLLVGMFSLTTLSAPGHGKQMQGIVLYDFGVAVGLILASTISKVLLGAIQERIFYSEDGDTPSLSETMFFQNLFALPIFGITFRDVYFEATSWFAEHEDRIAIYGYAIPVIVIYLVINIIGSFLSQRALISLVSSGNNSLCVLNITLYRYVSIILSLAIFNQQHTSAAAYIASLLVPIGSLLFLWDTSGTKQKTV